MIFDRLQMVYPFLQASSIGNSVLGREIPEILIGSGDKRVHYNGSFHANEWITTPIILTFLNDYLLSLTNQNYDPWAFDLPFLPTNEPYPLFQWSIQTALI